MDIYAVILISGIVSSILAAGLYLSGRSSDSYEYLNEIVNLGKPILYKSIDNTGNTNFTLLRNMEELQVFDTCRQQIGDLVYDYVSCSFQNGVRTVYLYRDEIMNDDLISKIQDELYPRNCDVKVIYNWKSNL